MRPPYYYRRHSSGVIKVALRELKPPVSQEASGLSLLSPVAVYPRVRLSAALRGGKRRGGKLFCFRRVKKQGRCGGHLKVSYDSPEECCAGKGAGFFSKKQKVGRNRFVCTPCTDLQTPSDRQGDVSPKAKQLNRKPGQKQPVPETTTESKTTTQQTTTTTTVQDWLRPENDHPASHYVSFRRPDDDVDRVEWSQWSPCSASCGAGWRSRYKICDNCDKNDPENVMSQPCMVNFYCNVDGNWGPWFPWQPCSQSCGGGTRLRQRKCNYPPPAYGGSPCSGPAKNSQDCNEQPCPVDGNWGEWSEFTLCSATCGLGTKKRMRECDNPAPASGGRMCAGLPVFAKKCEIAKCPLDGGWSEWSEFGFCRAPRCDTGFRIRTRVCNNPRPQHGGAHCQGNQYEREECFNEQECPRNGSWCEWSEWSACSASCAEQTSLQARQRTCTCPEPRYGGIACEGDSFTVRECEDLPRCSTSEVDSTARKCKGTEMEGSGSDAECDEEEEQDSQDGGRWRLLVSTHPSETVTESSSSTSLLLWFVLLSTGLGKTNDET
ncbi:hypothetical protein C0Q70_15049 [Pomacea canaliculata]|uniref:EGF-like domain-containing protein n=1 Tax=Pomacea canaliculata TaxID=400727 RepID=A0A2T7NTU6_POMCA|nr:hypothetical protein C0Q70_15049 [Pomacea canaliculata]